MDDISAFEDPHNPHKYGELVSLTSSPEESEVFVRERKGRVGSSEIASVLGLGYDTPLKLWCKMTGRLDSVAEQSEAMVTGKVIEPSIAKLFELKTKYPTRICQSSFSRADVPWAVATPDYLYQRDGLDWILEIKNIGEYSREKWDEKIPDYAHCQIIWQMGLTGIHRGTVVALIGGRDIVYRDIEFDQGVFDQLIEAGKKFIDMVNSGTPPSATADDRELLVKTYGVDPDKTTEINDESFVKAAVEWRAIDEQKKKLQGDLKSLERKQRDVEAFIREGMRSASLGIIGDRFLAKVTHVKRASYTVAPSEYYTFKVKENNGN